MYQPDEIKEKTKNFPFGLENKTSPQDKISVYTNETKPDSYTPHKKSICDWTDKKNYLIHSRILKFFVRLGMMVDKVHELVSFRQRNWLEK